MQGKEKRSAREIRNFGGFMASLDIILPAYNPLPGWETIVTERFQSLVKALPELNLRLFVVNDGSRDLDEQVSLSRLREVVPDAQWISYMPNRGKGYALRQGVEQAHGDYVVYTDIDWPYTEESMVLLIRRLAGGVDAAIGIRDEKYYAHLPPGRRRISRWLRKINGVILRLSVNDTQAGLKGFRQPVRSIFLATTIDRYLFDLEFVYLLSRRQNLVIQGIPITLREGITFSKMNRKILLQEARNFLRVWLKS